MANAATLKSPKPHTTAATTTHAPRHIHPLIFAMLSHRGHVRHVNQDACAASPEHGAFIVCDGVGGAAAGEVASHLAADTFLHSVSHPAKSPATTASIRLEQAVHAANHAVFQRSQKLRALRGMATTLVAVLVEDDPAHPAFWIAHVGDSRCYRFRNGALELLTIDHSLVEEQVRAGQLSRAEAETSPIRNVITRAIGSGPTVDPEFAAHATQSGDVFLLASDGLTRELDDDAIAHILSRATSLESACHALIDAANANGGRDNITVLLLACP